MALVAAADIIVYILLSQQPSSCKIVLVGIQRETFLPCCGGLWCCSMLPPKCHHSCRIHKLTSFLSSTKQYNVKHYPGKVLLYLPCCCCCYFFTNIPSLFLFFFIMLASLTNSYATQKVINLSTYIKLLFYYYL